MNKKLLVLAFLLLLLAPLRSRAQSPPPVALTGVPAEVHSLKITILSTMLADKGIGEWGFAALVETDGHKILFDTGARPNTVLREQRPHPRLHVAYAAHR